MLAKIAPRFVISRVIQTSYLAQNQMVEVLKQPLGSHEDYFHTQDPQDYFKVKFYGYISSLSKPNNFTNKYQERAYDQACSRFKQFNETLELYERMCDVQSEARMLYSYVQRNNSSSNIFSQRLETDKKFEKDIISGIEKYTKLEDSLAQFPQWQDKVKDQIGNWYHLIHNNLAESDSKRRIFNKLNRQEYFV